MDVQINKTLTNENTYRHGLVIDDNFINIIGNTVIIIRSQYDIKWERSAMFTRQHVNPHWVESNTWLCSPAKLATLLTTFVTIRYDPITYTYIFTHYIHFHIYIIHTYRGTEFSQTS